MSRKVKQFRYYSENNSENYPSDLMTKNNLVQNNIFADYLDIKQIGIQTMPGVSFKLNSEAEENWVTIGLTGIYELDLEDLIDITSIQFDKTSVENVAKNETGYIIIDILYDKEDE